MWLTSNSPTAFRTVWCSSTRPEYWTGMSHPPKSTILAPRERCMALSGVDLSGAGEDMDKGQNNRGWKGVSNVNIASITSTLKENAALGHPAEQIEAKQATVA